MTVESIVASSPPDASSRENDLPSTYACCFISVVAPLVINDLLPHIICLCFSVSVLHRSRSILVRRASFFA